MINSALSELCGKLFTASTISALGWSLMLIQIGAPHLVHAQHFVDPIQGPWESAGKYGGVLTLANLDYENNDTSTEFTIERTLLGGEYHEKLARNWSFVGQVALAADVEYSGNYDGNGINLGGGLKALLKAKEQHTFGFCGSLIFNQDNVKRSVNGTSNKLSSNFLELPLMGTYAYHVSRTLRFYGALEAIPVIRGEVKVDSGEFSADRDDFVQLRAGANVDLAEFSLRPELTLLTSQTLILALTQNF